MANSFIHSEQLVEGERKVSWTSGKTRGLSAGPVARAEVTPSNAGSFQEQEVPMAKKGSGRSEKGRSMRRDETLSPADKWKFEYLMAVIYSNGTNQNARQPA